MNYFALKRGVAVHVGGESMRGHELYSMEWLEDEGDTYQIKFKPIPINVPKTIVIVIPEGLTKEEAAAYLKMIT